MRALAFALCLLFSATGSADENLGKAVYARRCAACHGLSGKADTNVGKKYGVADFTAKDWAKHWSRKSVRKLVEDGVPHKMPAWKSTLSDAEVDAVSAYVLELARGKR